MDPLSLLAGIAGVATAGIQVSKAIYDLVSTIRGTPKEISDIARGVSDLSMVWKEASRRDSTTQWLYELVFSPYVESRSGLPTAAKSSDDEAEAEGVAQTDGVPNEERALLVSNPPEGMQLAAIMEKPVEVASVVDELLAEWTTLTEDEIAGVSEKRPSRSKGTEVPTIKFKDAVGRKFSFPYHLVQTWAGTEKLIKEAFVHVDVIGPHVQEGRYDIIGPSGEIILPSVWEHVIQPGDAFTMHMWPLDKVQLQGAPHHTPELVPSVQKQSGPSPGAIGTALGSHDSRRHSHVEIDKTPSRHRSWESRDRDKTHRKSTSRPNVASQN
ncbi:hypothetical protein F5144DRAFT_607669 [Chaetomium tenue]|uniref:Uncharacterized protein n=1 Tax=Chaetomium tenue TaxID=1854479 RepID=A0ACB7PMQ3_9PEZI|nr:hypothetical protein F5144DRAFT_607669 [Chaetomium globosum]